MLVFALPMLVLGLYWAMGATPVADPALRHRDHYRRRSASIFLSCSFARAPPGGIEEILNGFPDALDLMLVCVEAGLGLEAAFARVGMEMTESHPPSGRAIRGWWCWRCAPAATARMRSGGWPIAPGADEIRAFATLLIQSTKLGSSIAQTLRVYASEMRERRRMRAEEKAHRLPVLLSIPLVACMLPVMIGVLMLPAAIRVMRAVIPALTGGGG